MDVSETEKGYKVVAELPGMNEKNIEVARTRSGSRSSAKAAQKITNGMLTIKGEKQEEKEEEKQDYYLRERNFGSFERSFPVPDGVELDKVDASFKKGVLTVTLRKQRRRRRRRRRSR